MNRLAFTALVFTPIGVAALGCGSAQAAACPAFPPATIKFEALPSNVERDTGKTAKELASMRSATDPLPVTYDRSIAGSATRDVGIQKLPDGTVCAAVQVVHVKLGYKRKIYVAKEFAQDECVANTMADFEMPAVKNDDAVLAAFGASLDKTYGAELNAIGTNAARSSEDAQKPLLAKASALFQDKIYPAFEQQVVAGAGKVDMSKWQKASCDGATDKAFASISVKPEQLQNSKQTQAPSTPQPAYTGGGRGGH